MINLPIDANGKEIQITPNVVALATTYDTSVSSSTEVTLNTNTSYIEVAALVKGIFLKWGGTASSTSFDEYIPADSLRTFVKPNGQTSVQFIEQTSAATLVLIEK